MKKYEYKFAQYQIKLGFDFSKKVTQIEEEWNKLGSDGWQFCYSGDGVLVFMREIAENE